MATATVPAVRAQAAQLAPGRRSLYREIVEDFLARGIHSGRVEVPGHATANVAAGLGGAVEGLGAPRRVCRRGEHAYLVRVAGHARGEPHI